MNGLLISSSHVKSLVELIGVLVIFVFVLVITYLTTRWMGGFQKAKLKNKNLSLIETIGVGNNKTISIVEVGKKYIVVAVGKDSVTLLTELKEEELKDFSFVEEGMTQTGNFQEILSKLKAKMPKK